MVVWQIFFCITLKMWFHCFYREIPCQSYCHFFDNNVVPSLAAFINLFLSLSFQWFHYNVSICVFLFIYPAWLPELLESVCYLLLIWKVLSNDLFKYFFLINLYIFSISLFSFWLILCSSLSIWLLFIDFTSLSILPMFHLFSWIY